MENNSDHAAGGKAESAVASHEGGVGGLLPCPFCGSTKALKLTTTHEILESEEYPYCDAVVCDASTVSKLGGCGATSPFCESKTEAIAAWNRRSGMQQLARDALEEIALHPGLKFSPLLLNRLDSTAKGENPGDIW